MSQQPASPTTVEPSSSPASPQAAKAQTLFPIHRSWTIALGVAVAMVLLAMVGVALTTTSSSFAPVYWVSLVPVYGLLCIGTAWVRAGQGHTFDRALVTRQLLHWVGVAIALGLDFFIRRTGEETGVGAGLNAVLLLALGCYLAGIHLEWMFVPVGVLLTVTLLLVAKTDQYMWLIFVVGGLTIVAMFGLHRLLGRAAKAA